VDRDPRHAGALLIAALTLVLAACSAGSPSAAPAPSTPAPSTPAPSTRRFTADRPGGTVAVGHRRHAGA